jgi:hypothetical protein
MVQEIASKFPESILAAETDLDAVGFYERCGFE